MKHRRLSAPEQTKLDDDARLLRGWKQWHRAERDAALAGPHGAMLSELLRMVGTLEHAKPAQLVGFMRSIDWGFIDYDTRLNVLHELNIAIVTFREKHGLAPFDDGASDEPTTPFLQTRALLLFPPCEAPSGAQPGFEEPIEKHQEHSS
jgi:hypothetical protein